MIALAPPTARLVALLRQPDTSDPCGCTSPTCFRPHAHEGFAGYRVCPPPGHPGHVRDTADRSPVGATDPTARLGVA